MITEVELVLNLPKTISLNQLYAGKHWTYRKKIKDDYKRKIEAELERYDHYTCEGFTIAIRYHTRHDLDNVILVSKFVADTLVANGWCADDSPKYYKRLSIEYDATIEKDSYEVRIKLIGASLS